MNILFSVVLSGLVAFVSGSVLGGPSWKGSSGIIATDSWGWNGLNSVISPAVSAGAVITPAVAGKSVLTPAVSGGAVITPAVAGKTVITPAIAGGATIVGPSVAKAGLTSVASIIGPRDGGVTIIGPRDAGVRLIGPNVGLPSLLGDAWWADLLAPVTKSLAGAAVIGPTAETARVIGPNIGASSGLISGALDLRANDLGIRLGAIDNILKTIVTNGGGTINLSANSAIIRGPLSAPAVVKGPAGKIITSDIGNAKSGW